MRFFTDPKLLVTDELGYLPLPADGASALFQVDQPEVCEVQHQRHHPTPDQCPLAHYGQDRTVPQVSP
jgi:hypothetical protein